MYNYEVVFKIGKQEFANVIKMTKTVFNDWELITELKEQLKLDCEIQLKSYRRVK